MNAPTPSLPIPEFGLSSKAAGLADAGIAALLGVLFGRASGVIPQLQDLRQTNPMLYDAALGASVLSAMDAIQANRQPQAQQPVPGGGQGFGMIPPAVLV